MSGRTRAVAGLIAVLASACSGGTPEPGAPSTLPVRSNAFDEGRPIPVEHTCDGEDRSPSLAWSVPATVGEWAITMVDLDADFVHWVAYAIPAETSGVLVGDLPEGSIEGENSFARTGYGGPCPPQGDAAHRYEFRVYALDRALSPAPEPGLDRQGLLARIGCCVQVYGTLTGTYRR